MLELIFQGFLEWIYGMILEAWEFFSDKLIDLMSMDFAYLQTHIPILPAIRQSMLAVGWALLIGNLVFQALRSMMAGIGFEAEDPKLLFSRTFVFSFLLLASPQICDICLNMTSTVIGIMQLPDAVDIDIIHESAFDGLACAWLLVFICGIIVMFQSFKLIFEMAERYFILAMLTICAPLAFGMGGSRNTNDIFTGWCRMYGSMCVLMVLNVVFVKMLFSVLPTVPTGLSVLPWMVLVLTIVKVAKKADAIVTRIGLNPAITGDSLGRTFPGMLTYMVTRTAVSQATKALGKNLGKNDGSRSTASGGGTGGRHTEPKPPWHSGANGAASRRGRKKPIIVSAEDWESEQNGKGAQTSAAQSTETHSSVKTQAAETIRSGTKQTTQAKPTVKPEQTRRTSVPRDAERIKTSAKPVVRTAAANSAPKADTPAQKAGGKDGKTTERTAGTASAETARFTNVPANARVQPRDATRQVKETVRDTRKSAGNISQRTDGKRMTRNTASQAKAGTAGTLLGASAHQGSTERQGRTDLTMTGSARATARQEKSSSLTPSPRANGKDAAIRSGTAGTDATVSARRSTAERHSRNTTVRQSAVSTAQTANVAPAPQEQAPVPKTPATESGRTPPIVSGMAGTGVAQATRLTIREGRQGRKTLAESLPPAEPKKAKTPDTARQENRPSHAAVPHAGGTTGPMRSGTAGTAPGDYKATQSRVTARRAKKDAQAKNLSDFGLATKTAPGAAVSGNKKTTRKSAVKKGHEQDGTK